MQQQRATISGAAAAVSAAARGYFFQINRGPAASVAQWTKLHPANREIVR